MLCVGLIFSFLGLLCWGAYVFSRIRCRTPIDATVCKVSARKSIWRGKSLAQFTPYVTYTVGEKTYTEKTDLSTYQSGKYTVGQVVRIYVDSRRPSRFRYGWNLNVLIFGAVFFLPGVLLVLLSLI